MQIFFPFLAAETPKKNKNKNKNTERFITAACWLAGWLVQLLQLSHKNKNTINNYNKNSRSLLLLSFFVVFFWGSSTATTRRGSSSSSAITK
jgi:hypothetical protein